MEIKNATKSDIEDIVLVIENAKKIMILNNNTSQWSKTYPSKEIITEDIENNNAYICIENNIIIGYFCFFIGNEPNYNNIYNGSWINDKPYGVIHRLASSSKYKGIAKSSFDYAFSKINNIRVDTHKDNIPMQNFLIKNSFKYCGTIYVSNGTTRDAFQKTI